MTLGNTINRLRTDAKLTQEQFAEIFKVTQQSVQKWERDVSTPDLDKLIRMSRYFDVSLDSLVLGMGKWTIEEMHRSRQIKPSFENMVFWEKYTSNLFTEYHESLEEGLAIESYRDIFYATSHLPTGETKEKIGDALFDLVVNAKQREDYPYTEPSELEGIKALRKQTEFYKDAPTEIAEEKICGAWMGSLAGQIPGYPLEGIRTEELNAFLKETDNYPMHRLVESADFADEIVDKYHFAFKSRISGVKDRFQGTFGTITTNNTILAQQIIEESGRDFSPFDVSFAWLKYQGKLAYATAEQVAYSNFVKGYGPPQSAFFKNPYREWWGAMVRGHYFGFVNPGNPELAAEMAWRDASVSHVKNGIYGEMFVAAMIAAAALTDDVNRIIRTGIGEIPTTSRLYECITLILDAHEKGVSIKECLELIYGRYNEHMDQHAYHAIPNAMIIAASLLYGEGDFEKSVYTATSAAFCGACNGSAVGAVLGMAKGMEVIPSEWLSMIGESISTSLFNIGTVKVSERIELTMKHIANR